MNIEEFKKLMPESVKVFDRTLEKNIILDLCEDGRYITRRNMGTPKRRLFHYWSIECIINNLVK